MNLLSQPAYENEKNQNPELYLFDTTHDNYVEFMNGARHHLAYGSLAGRYYNHPMVEFSKDIADIVVDSIRLISGGAATVALGSFLTPCAFIAVFFGLPPREVGSMASLIVQGTESATVGALTPFGRLYNIGTRIHASVSRSNPTIVQTRENQL